jgi:hypothetical protein
MAFGINGKENDTQVKGIRNEEKYYIRILEIRLSRFLISINYL